MSQILTNYYIERQEFNKTDPRSFLFLRMGLLTEWRGLRLTLRSCILMLASCSAWACWIPATIAWQRERELAGDRKGHKAKCYTMNIEVFKAVSKSLDPRVSQPCMKYDWA